MTIEALLHESNLIEGIDSAEADQQLMFAWDMLSNVDFPDLTYSDICMAQKIATLKQDNLLPSERGYTRRYSMKVVTAGGQQLIPNAIVDNLMHNWLMDYQDMDPITAHVRFEKMHPFVDGNGRTGRLLLWWHEQCLGMHLTELTLSNRVEYYGWFK